MKVLVLGASEKATRTSNQAIHMLLEYQHDVLAIGARRGQAHGVSIRDHEILSDDVDTVTMYLRPDLQGQYRDYILNLAPRRVIFNPGTEHPELAHKLSRQGVQVEEACTLVLLRTDQF